MGPATALLNGSKKASSPRPFLFLFWGDAKKESKLCYAGRVSSKIQDRVSNTLCFAA